MLLQAYLIAALGTFVSYHSTFYLRYLQHNSNYSFKFNDTF